MAIGKKRIGFFASDEGVAILALLTKMAADNGFNTASSYSADAALHPDGQISFVDKHMQYINNHPQIDARQYVANLRLMTRVL